LALPGLTDCAGAIQVAPVAIAEGNVYRQAGVNLVLTRRKYNYPTQSAAGQSHLTDVLQFYGTEQVGVVGLVESNAAGLSG